MPSSCHRIGLSTMRGRLRSSTVSMSRMAATFVLCTTLFHGAAEAAEVKVFTSRAIATVLERSGAEFERATGHKLTVVSGFSPIFVKQIRDGEPFDVVVAPPSTVDALIKDGHVVADSRKNLVRSGFGVAVRAGAPKPDIRSVGAFKRALLDARSIGYIQTAGVPQLVDRPGPRDRTGWPFATGDSVLHHVRLGRECHLEGPGRRASADQVPHRSSRRAGRPGARHGACGVKREKRTRAAWHRWLESARWHRSNAPTAAARCSCGISNCRRCRAVVCLATTKTASGSAPIRHGASSATSS